MIFWDQKSQNQIFFNFFIKKFSNFISNLNDNCSQLSFEVYNVFVAQKLPISEFLIEFFSSGPWPLRRPPEAAISTSATSIGYQILVKYVSFHMRYCLLVWSENGEWLDYVSQNGWIPPPPGIWKTKKPGSFRVKGLKKGPWWRSWMLHTGRSIEDKSLLNQVISSFQVQPKW